jgi:ribonuclease BN (tRNA processing enzyme)
VKIQLIGTSEHLAQGDRSISCVMTSGEESCLIDCGPSFVERWLGGGSSVWDIDFAVVSHVHPDHASGLPSLVTAAAIDASQGRRPASRDLKLLLEPIVADVYEPVLRAATPLAFRSESGPGLCEIIRANDGRMGDIAISGWRVSYAPSAHAVAGVALRLEGPASESLAYVGDSKVTADIVGLVSGAQAALCSVFGTHDRVDRAARLGFMTAREAGQLARDSGIALLIIQHVFDATNKDGVLAEATAAAGSGVEVVVAKNGQELTLNGSAV